MVEQYNLPVILARQPLNKGKLMGAKAPLRPHEVNCMWFLASATHTSILQIIQQASKFVAIESTF
jgi:hypothetical protein